MNEYEELEYYREEFQNQNRVDNIIGSDPKFREIVKECLKVAKTDIPVLLTARDRNRQGSYGEGFAYQ